MVGAHLRDEAFAILAVRMFELPSFPIDWRKVHPAELPRACTHLRGIPAGEPTLEMGCFSCHVDAQR